jgi:hypothetical protein
MSWVNAMDFNFATSSEEICKQFGMRVKSGELAEHHMTAPLEAVKSKEDFTTNDAVTVIKNISLAAYYVPTERTDFQSVCGEALLHAASFIPTEGSPNFKILLALYRSQIKPDETSFETTARSEIIGNMLGRFDSLVNGDASKAEHMKSVFAALLKKDSRFSVYSY